MHQLIEREIREKERTATTQMDRISKLPLYFVICGSIVSAHHIFFPSPDSLFLSSILGINIRNINR